MALRHRIGFVAAALLAASIAASPAKAVVTVAPYQAYLYNQQCGINASCSIVFPKVPQAYRVVLNHASCYIRASHDFVPNYVELIVYTPQGQVLAGPLLTVNNTSNGLAAVQTYTANVDTSAFANAGNHFEIQAGLLGGNFLTISCNIDGNAFKLN